MLKTLDEIRKVEMFVGNIENGVDNPNLLSVDSTSIIQTPPDEVKSDESKTVDVTDTSKAVQDIKEKEDAEAAVKAKEVEEAKTKEEAKPKTEEDVKAKAPTETKDAVQKRIDDLTKKRRTAERERDFERAQREKEVAALKVEIAKLGKQIPSAEKPKKDDFDTDEEYLEALTDWKVDQKLKADKTEELKRKEETVEKEEVNEAFAALDDVMEQGRTKYKDFNDTVLSDSLPMSQQTVEIVLESENATEILYYLGKNPEESAAIAKMSPLKAAKTIASIEAKLAASVEEKTAEQKVETKVEKKTSNAPAPIVPVKTTGAVEKDPNQMTPKEYRAWRERNKQ